MEIQPNQKHATVIHDTRFPPVRVIYLMLHFVHELRQDTLEYFFVAQVLYPSSDVNITNSNNTNNST